MFVGLLPARLTPFSELELELEKAASSMLSLVFDSLLDPDEVLDSLSEFRLEDDDCEELEDPFRLRLEV